VIKVSDKRLLRSMMQEVSFDAVVSFWKGRTEGAHLRIAFQSVRLIHRQTRESFYSLLLVILDTAEKDLPNTGVR
jgi:hypothetical protein